MKNYEIIKFIDNDIVLDVNVSPEENTVWLTKEEMAILFNRDRTVISRHISNIFNENELDKETSVHFLHISQNSTNPRHRPAEYFSLDVIISVGYRVKSQRGVVFRKWATNVLRQFMLKGYAIADTRCLECKNSILELKTRVLELEKQQKQEIVFLPHSEDISHKKIEELFKTATREILIVDNYFGHNFDDVLKDSGVEVTIITNINNRKIDSNDIYKVVKTNCEHDRFIIVDDSCYHFGMSIESLGEKFSLGHKITDEYVIKFLKELKFLN